MAQFLKFQDINAPVEVDGDAELLRMVPRILPGWPYETSDRAEAEPFVTITGQGPDGYLCTSHITGAPTRKLDAVNAVCDVVAAMSYALVASQSRFLCLHAAAIEIGGRLVVIPSTRRAGKSTLTAALAHDGHGVFTDDALPVTRDLDGRLVGRASGVYPRVRLPFPEMPGADLGDWVARNPGPENEQYKYLSIPDLPAAGRLAPLGAVVMLERAPDQAPALSPVDPETAMDRLLFQNFTREVHSAEVLNLMSRVVLDLPIYRLTYAEAPEASRMLATAFADWPDPVPHGETSPLEMARADLDRPAPVVQVGAGSYLRRDGAAMARIGEALYLSDPEGGRIHRLNPVSSAIWAMLETPSSATQLRDVLAEAFPDTDRDRIESDVVGFMTQLGKAGLIVPA